MQSFLNHLPPKVEKQYCYLKIHLHSMFILMAFRNTGAVSYTVVTCYQTTSSQEIMNVISLPIKVGAAIPVCISNTVEALNLY